MKHFYFLSALMLFFVCNINAQQATIISFVSQEGEGIFSVFGNSFEDVTFVNQYIKINRTEVRRLNQRVEVDLAGILRNEMEQRNASFLNLFFTNYTLEIADGRPITGYNFISIVYERVGNRYYVIADSSKE